jgi:hypothetical protein
MKHEVNHYDSFQPEDLFLNVVVFSQYIYFVLLIYPSKCHGKFPVNFLDHLQILMTISFISEDDQRSPF